MRVFITGGTGVLGRRVLPLLVREGHAVTSLARSPDRAQWITAQGATPVAIDLFDQPGLTAAMDGHEVVLNLATHIPHLTAMAFPRAWAENSRIRTDGSRAVVGAAQDAGVRRVIQESISLTYDDGGERLLDESTAFTDDAPPTTPVRAAEGHARHFAREAVVLRFSYFYGAGASHTMSQLRLARRGVAPLMGSPTAYQSYVHLDDAASAVLAALDVAPGVYNVAESEPATVAEISRALAHAVGRPALRRVPVPRWAVGRANGFLFHSLRVSNARFVSATSWRPAYPNPEAGWAQVAAATVESR